MRNISYIFHIYSYKGRLILKFLLFDSSCVEKVLVKVGFLDLRGFCCSALEWIWAGMWVSGLQWCFITVITLHAHPSYSWCCSNIYNVLTEWFEGNRKIFRLYFNKFQDICLFSMKIYIHNDVTVRSQPK